MCSFISLKAEILLMHYSITSDPHCLCITNFFKIPDTQSSGLPRKLR